MCPFTFADVATDDGLTIPADHALLRTVRSCGPCSPADHTLLRTVLSCGPCAAAKRALLRTVRSCGPSAAAKRALLRNVLSCGPCAPADHALLRTALSCGPSSSDLAVCSLLARISRFLAPHCRAAINFSSPRTDNNRPPVQNAQRP